MNGYNEYVRKPSGSMVYRGSKGIGRGGSKMDRVKWPSTPGLVLQAQYSGHTIPGTTPGPER